MQITVTVSDAIVREAAAHNLPVIEFVESLIDKGRSAATEPVAVERAIERAKARGAKFIVSTDAHHPNHLLNMRYGILTARRGGLAAEDIMNTYPAERFLQAVRTSRG